jgi:uncharacterized membrane protein YidH (DUF202 family)
MSQKTSQPGNSDIHPDREQLFGNEAFAIGMLQVVSGGSVIAGISQIGAITEHSGKTPFLVFLTLMALGLLAAILAAYWRHQYKMWDVKRRPPKANWYLWAMRYSMLVAVIFVISGVLWLVGAFWYAEYCAA